MEHTLGFMWQDIIPTFMGAPKESKNLKPNLEHWEDFMSGMFKFLFILCIFLLEEFKYE
jgi:hypothetical protein